DLGLDLVVREPRTKRVGVGVEADGVAAAAPFLEGPPVQVGPVFLEELSQGRQVAVPPQLGGVLVLAAGRPEPRDLELAGRHRGPPGAARAASPAPRRRDRRSGWPGGRNTPARPAPQARCAATDRRRAAPAP